MKKEVLSRYKAQKEARCKYKGRGEPISRFVFFQKVRQEESKAKGREGKKWPAGLLGNFTMCGSAGWLKAWTQSWMVDEISTSNGL